MIIFGIDPGLSVTGYGILKKEGHKATLLDSGFLKMSSTKSIAERVHIFYEFVKNKIETHAVNCIAFETPFLGKNAQNFLKLGYLRGIVYLLISQHNLTLYEYSPREVKLAVTGYGAADKDQVATIIKRLFPQLISPEKADVTDALAVTLCCLWNMKGVQLRQKI